MAADRSDADRFPLGIALRFPRRRSRRGLRPEFVEEQFARPESIPCLTSGKRSLQQSFGLSANPFSMQYHSLLALPLLLVAMTLIAATVSMRFAGSASRPL